MAIKIFICLGIGAALGLILGLIMLAIEKYDRWKNG